MSETLTYEQELERSILLKPAIPVLHTARELFGHLSPKQAEIVEFEEDEIFLGGGAGSGKTRAAIIAWAVRAFEFQARGFTYNALALRKTFPQLREIIQLAKDMLLPLGASWHESSKTMVLPGGSTLECGFIDADENRYQFQGRSWQVIIWDEIQRYASFTSYDWLFSRLRAPIKNINGQLWRLPLRVYSTANPKGPGNNWLRKRFIEPVGVNGGTFQREVTAYTPDGEQVTVKRSVRFQHSTVMDN